MTTVILSKRLPRAVAGIWKRRDSGTGGRLSGTCCSWLEGIGILPRRSDEPGLPDVSLSSSSIRMRPGRSSPLRSSMRMAWQQSPGDWIGQRLMSFHRKLTMIRRAYVSFDGIAVLDTCICLRASIRLFEVPVSPIEGNDDGLWKSGGEVGLIGRSRRLDAWVRLCREREDDTRIVGAQCESWGGPGEGCRCGNEKGGQEAQTVSLLKERRECRRDEEEDRSCLQERRARKSATALCATAHEGMTHQEQQHARGKERRSGPNMSRGERHQPRLHDDNCDAVRQQRSPQRRCAWELKENASHVSCGFIILRKSAP